jgi:hypothetical protein
MNFQPKCRLKAINAIEVENQGDYKNVLFSAKFTLFCL